MKKKLVAILTVLFALVLGFGVLTACGGSKGELTINETDVTLEIGETRQLVATSENNEAITWSSSDENVVVIQREIASLRIAFIEAKGAGQATVTATSESGKTAECRVTVENIVVEITGEGVANGKLQMERGASVKLSAAVKKEGVDLNEAVRWSSMDENLVSVSEDGTVTALKKGTTTIVATRANGASRGEVEVTVTWEEPDGYYELEINEQNKITPNLWGYWVDTYVEPQYNTNIKVTNAEYLGDPTGTGLIAGGVTMTYENTFDGANEHGVQLFYRSSKGYNEANKDMQDFTPYDESKLLLEVGANYLLKLDITVTASGIITVNGTEVEVKANQKQALEIPFQHTDTGLIYPTGDYTNLNSAVFLMMGAHSNGSMIQAATVTLENVRWEAWNGETGTLSAPSLTVSGKTVTINDPNEAGVKNYTIALFEKGAAANADPVASTTTTEKTVTLDDSRWPNGDYELRVRANGTDQRYADSDWSAGVDYTVSHGAVQYELKQGGASEAKADTTDSYFYAAVENEVAVETATYNDGTITLAFSGSSNWYSLQLFYKNHNLTNGKKYTLTFTLNVAGLTYTDGQAPKVRINGKMFDIAEGNNDIEVSYTEGTDADGVSMSIQFGEPDTTSVEWTGTIGVVIDATVTISDIEWNSYVAPAGSIPEGGQDSAVADPNKWYLWADLNYVGSNVTIVDQHVDLEGKELILDYTTTGAPRLGYSVQLFYENSANVTGTVYTLTLKVKLSVAGTITINDTQYTFTAGETKDISITYTEKGNAGQYNEGASIVILMGIPVPDGQDGSANAVMNAKITVSDWSWGNVDAEQLQTPTALAVSGKTVTFTDPNEAAKVGGYELGFFSGDTIKGTIRVTSGAAIDDSAIDNGTYTLKVRALGKDLTYTASEWSQGVEYTVNNAGGPSYDITKVADQNEAVAKNDGRYYYWIENGTATGKFQNGAVTLNVTGNVGNWYNTQLFMRDPTLTVGNVYTVKMTITLSAAGDIFVNGDVVTLTANQPYSFEKAGWTQTANEASVSIQLGKPVGSSGVIISGDLTLKVENVTFTPAATLATPSFTLEGKTVHITDTQNTGVSYELGFFKKADDAAPANTLTVADGDTFNDEMIPAGEYTLKLRATKAGSNPSEWSQGQTHTVVKGATDYTVMQWGEEYNNGNLSSDGKWVYWTDTDNSVEVEYARLYENNGKYTIAVKEGAKNNSNSLGWGFQIFHNDMTNYTKGQQYTLTLTANAKSNMTLTINKQDVTLTANTDKPLSISFTLTVDRTNSAYNNYEDVSLLEVAVPQTVGTTYEFELKDIAWTAGSSSGNQGGQGGNQGGQGGSAQYDLKSGDANAAKADTTSYYYNAVPGEANVQTATYNNGVITLTYSGNSNWYSTQLFYKNPTLTSGTQYTLTFTLNSPHAGKIRINWTMFDLVAGDNSISVTYTEGTGNDGLSLNIQFGEPNAAFDGTVSVLAGGTYTLSNMVWTAAN